MKRPESNSHLVARVGLVVGVALLAGVLFAVSLAVSAQPARPASVGAGLVPDPGPARDGAPAPYAPAPLGASAPAAQAGPAASATSADPAKAVQRAWQRASDLGVYHFATSLVERRYPAPSLANVGSGPQEQAAYLDGEADLPARKLTLRLWTGGGSAANPADAAEMLIEGDKAYTRRAGGDPGTGGGGAGAADGAVCGVR